MVLRPFPQLGRCKPFDEGVGVSGGGTVTPILSQKPKVPDRLAGFPIVTPRLEIGPA